MLYDLWTIKVGGGGVQGYNFGNFNYEIRVEEEGGGTRPDFFRVVLGPCAQFYPCEA